MTPIGLLTKSNSIRGMSERAPGYRLTKLALPKFGAPSRVTGLRVEMEPEQQPLLVPVRIAEAKPVVEEAVALKKVEIEEVQVLDVPQSMPMAKRVSVESDGAAGAAPYQGLSLPKFSLPKFSLPKIDFRGLMARIKLPKRAPKVVRFVREEEPNQAPVSLPKLPEDDGEVMAFAVIEPSAPIAPRLPVRIPSETPVGKPAEMISGTVRRDAEQSDRDGRGPKTAGLSEMAPVLAKGKSGSNAWELLLRRITFRRRVVKVAGVQTELALDRVSPVRNDLSDADLEVIPRMDTRKRETNPFRNGSKVGRVKKAKEETNAAPPMVPSGAMVEKPTE